MQTFALRIGFDLLGCSSENQNNEKLFFFIFCRRRFLCDWW